MTVGASRLMNYYRVIYDNYTKPWLMSIFHDSLHQFYRDEWKSA